MVFAAVEIAMAAKKAFANAKVAIASAFSAPFPLGFAAGAAMIGIMTSLLGGGFGSSASAPTVGPAGTGTTLGDSDAQSESLAASQELFKDIQLDQLAELRGIKDGISDLAGGINQLTKNILSAGGLGTDFVQGLGTSGGFNLGGLAGPLAGGVAGFLGGAGATAALGLGASSIGLITAGVGTVITLALDKITGGFVSDLVNGLVGGLFGGKTKKEVIDSGIKFMSQTLGEVLETGIVDAIQFANIKIKKSGGLFGLLPGSTNFEQQTCSFSTRVY